jgi:hypothetical protein
MLFTLSTEDNMTEGERWRRWAIRRTTALREYLAFHGFDSTIIATGRQIRRTRAFPHSQATVCIANGQCGGLTSVRHISS